MCWYEQLDEKVREYLPADIPTNSPAASVRESALPDP